MSWRFITWSERKAYCLMSLARNDNVPVLCADIPMFIAGKDGSHCPYKSIVELDCDEAKYDSLIARMYEAVPK